MTDREEADGVVRSGGVMQLRARIARLERELEQERQAHKEARAHATKLADFIRLRVGTAAWSHVDVLKLVVAVHVRLCDDILSRMATMATGKAPASHILYRKAVEAAMKEAASRGRSAAVTGLHRPDMVKPIMQEELFQLIDRKD